MGVDTLPALGVEDLQPEVNMSPRYQNRIELLQGTLDLLILETLRWGPQHGYGISQAIRRNSRDILQVDTGSLYPALHRLERQKWITADWKVSENKQRVRVYRLTARGKKQLESERSRWAQLSDAIAGVLHPAKRESEA
jgi:PadR family transcriptional regulator, regulatory protein PadR